MVEGQGLRGGVLHHHHVEEAADAADHRGDREGQDLVVVGRDAHGPGHGLVLPDDPEGAAVLGPHEVVHQQEGHASDDEHDVVLPLVVGQSAPLRSGGEPGRGALRSAGEVAEALGQRDADDRQGDGDHRDGQPAEAGGGQGHHQPDDAAAEHGDDEHEGDVPVAVHPVGGHVGAEAEEEDLPQRDHAGVAHDHVQSEDGDGEHPDPGQGLVDGDGQQQRGHHEGEHHHDGQGELEPGLPEQSGGLRGHQTRTTLLRPNRPWGRTRSTTNSRMKGTAILRS